MDSNTRCWEAGVEIASRKRTASFPVVHLRFRIFLRINSLIVTPAKLANVLCRYNLNNFINNVGVLAGRMQSAATSNILRRVFPAFAVLGAFDEFVRGFVVDRGGCFLIPDNGLAGADGEAS